jgi:hypothetical protein
MKVSQLIHQLKKCHPDDDVEISIDYENTPEDEREFGVCIGLNEITPVSIGSVTLLCECEGKNVT